MNSSRLRLLAIFLATLIVAGGFTSLGIWQLHRAQEVARLGRPVADGAAIELAAVATPGENLRAVGINRIVHLTGKYLQSFAAPNQQLHLVSAPKKISVASLNVGLLILDPSGSSSGSGTSAILIARGMGGAEKLPEGSISIVGRLYPHQNGDHAAGDSQTLSRIDPALVAGISGLDLYDGFVQVISEKIGATEINFPRVASPRLKSSAPGYYWQHISYVFVWWFLAGLVLIAPFWSRRSNRLSSTLTSEI